MIQKYYRKLRRFVRRHRLNLVDRLIVPTGLFPSRLVDRETLQHRLRLLQPCLPERPLIRLGPNQDGGYLVPDALDGIAACFSCGVGRESGFEWDCAERGMEVYMADASVEGPALQHARFHFSPQHLSAYSGGSHLTLDRWVEQSGVTASAELIMQMDIEGAEYEVLLAASEALMQRCRILVVEFHGLDQLAGRAGLEKARALEKILQTHACVHIHPNNTSRILRVYGMALPHIMEFTFLRRDCMGDATPNRIFPHPLDAKNRPFKKDFALPSCWYDAQKM